MMTKLCIKIHMKSNFSIETAFPWILRLSSSISDKPFLRKHWLNRYQILLLKFYTWREISISLKLRRLPMMMRRTTIPNSSFLIIKKAALQKECGYLHIAIKKASQKDAALVHSSRSVTIQAIIVVRRQGFFGYSSQGYCSALSLRPKEYPIRTGLSRKFMRGI